MLAHFDRRIVRNSYFESLTQKAQALQSAQHVLNQFEIIKQCGRGLEGQAIDALEFCRSQLGQDLFVLCELKFKRNGYFVEFGATNGIDLSNSHILENKFGWRGIIAEPARVWHKALFKNRQCHIETKCVAGKSGEQVEFNETEMGELSTIKKFSDVDLHRELRQSGKVYQVETLSLIDLIDQFPPPRRILPRIRRDTLIIYPSTPKAANMRYCKTSTSSAASFGSSPANTITRQCERKSMRYWSATVTGECWKRSLNGTTGMSCVERDAHYTISP